MTTRLCPGCDAPVSSTSYRCAACRTKLPSDKPVDPHAVTGGGLYLTGGIVLMALAAGILMNADDDTVAAFAFILGFIGFGVMLVDLIAKGVELGIRRARRTED